MKKRKVFCEHCRWYRIDVEGGMDWFLFFDCDSPKNRFKEKDTYSHPGGFKREKPEVLNAANDCPLYQAASAVAVEWSRGKFAGPANYYTLFEKENA